MKIRAFLALTNRMGQTNAAARWAHGHRIPGQVRTRPQIHTQTDARFVRIMYVWVAIWGRVRACPGMRWPCAQRADASFCPILSVRAKNAQIFIKTSL